MLKLKSAENPSERKAKRTSRPLLVPVTTIGRARGRKAEGSLTESRSSRANFIGNKKKRQNEGRTLLGKEELEKEKHRGNQHEEGPHL